MNDSSLTSVTVKVEDVDGKVMLSKEVPRTAWDADGTLIRGIRFFCRTWIWPCLGSMLTWEFRGRNLNKIAISLTKPNTRIFCFASAKGPFKDGMVE